MTLPGFLKRMADGALARRGFERVASRLVYPWQRAPSDSPSHSGAALPAGAAEALRPDHPRLAELTRAYRELDSPMARDPVWTDALLATADLRHFRGDNPYVFQLRGRNLNELGYAVSYYCARRIAEVERLGLFERLEEDGLYGVHTFEIDGRRISRDLLDSVLELAFLERHLGISRGPRRTILDIGAGYGRLAYRGATAFPDTVRFLCTDAVATSTFLCEQYLGFRGVAGQESSPARVIPLHRLAESIPPGTVDVAVNVHSFSECSLAAIDAWIRFLAENRVGHLMIVPNAVAPDGVTMLTNSGQDFSRIVRQHGYECIASEPKYPDPVVQEYGISPAAHLLFRFPASPALARIAATPRAEVQGAVHFCGKEIPMGLFDFVKNAGAAIFGRDDKDDKDGKGGAPQPQTHTVSPAELDAMKRRKALEKLLGELSLEVEQLKIEVTGDLAVVHGLVDNQAEREKVVLALGNVIGIARVDDRLETKKTAPESQMYTVVSGDSLSKIAKKFYGDAGKYPAIFEANKPMLKDPDKIYPGQVLRIPPAG